MHFCYMVVVRKNLGTYIVTFKSVLLLGWLAINISKALTLTESDFTPDPV